MTNLVEYRAQLVAKLNAVDSILQDMGIQTTAPKPTHRPAQKLSASAKAKISAAKKAWWKKKRDGAAHK